MTDDTMNTLPIIPISLGVLVVIGLLSVLISKLADLCFDHYLINYSNYEHKHMIKQRFNAHFKNLLSTIKSEGPKKDENQTHISIIPSKINNAIKVERKKTKKDENKNENNNNNTNNSSQINEETSRSEQNAPPKTSFYVKNETVQGRLAKDNKVSAKPHFNATKSAFVFKNKIKDTNLRKSNEKSANIRKIANSNPYIEQPRAIINGSKLTNHSTNSRLTKVTENSDTYKINRVDKSNEYHKEYQKNSMLVEIWKGKSENPYEEKLTEKHSAAKRKLIKEKLKLFTVQKNSNLPSKDLHQVSTSTMNNEFTNNSELSLFNDGASISQSSSSPLNSNYVSNSILLSNTDRTNNIPSVAHHPTNSNPRKKVLIKQSTVETTISNDAN